jgi:hypothetical protein
METRRPQAKHVVALAQAAQWWLGVDDVNDRPIENPKRRCDEYSSNFRSVMKPKYINPVGKSQTQEGDACWLRDSSGQFIRHLI